MAELSQEGAVEGPLHALGESIDAETHVDRFDSEQTWSGWIMATAAETRQASRGRSGRGIRGASRWRHAGRCR